MNPNKAKISIQLPWNFSAEALFYSAIVVALMWIFPSTRAEAATGTVPKLTLEVQATGLDAPLDASPLPESEGVFFVLEAKGKIVKISVASAAEAELVAELAEKQEEGVETAVRKIFLGIALHPKFEENQKCYVSYIITGRYGTAFRVAEYQLSGAADKVVVSERVILEEPLSNGDARGGGLAFDKAGMLLVSLGDGGGRGDPKGHAQNARSILGTILRLNLDDAEGQATFIPPLDNPFVMNRAGAPEVYAFGFRDPRKISIDRESGEVWLGDRGETTFEEINLVSPAKNYGWSVYEGPQCLRMRFECLNSSLQPPAFYYKRSEGSAVTGGFVYRGILIPELEGAYIFGDFESGNIWALLPGIQGKRTAVKLFDTDYKLSSFAQDSSGEIFIFSWEDGELLKLLPESSRVRKAAE